MTKKHAILTLLTLILTLATTLISNPAQADDFTNIRNYQFKNQCLDVDTNTRSIVQIWSCDNGSDEKWSHTFTGSDAFGRNILHFTNLMTGNCLGVKDNGISQGDQIAVQPCGTGSTDWTIIYSNNENFDGWHQQFMNNASGLCLDLKGDNGTRGTPIWLWTCTPELVTFNGAQLWML